MAMGDAASGYYGARNVVRGGGPRYADPGTTRAGRIRTFEERAAENPGRAPGGSGATGLSPTDARGWSGLMEDQGQYLMDTGHADDVRLGSYGAPTNRGGGGMRATAMRGLQQASGGGGGGGGYGGYETLDEAERFEGMEGKNRFLTAENAGRDPMERIFGSRSVAGGVAEARRLGLMPQFDEGVERDVLAARGNAARRSMKTPMELAAEREDIGDRFEVSNAQRGAMAGAEAADITGQQRSREFWRRGLPMMEQELSLDQRLAETKGQAATYDDKLRTEAQKYAADQRLKGQQGAVEGSSTTSARNTALQTLQRMIGDYADRGDRATATRLQASYEKLLSEVPQGAGGGGPAPGTQRTVNGETREWNGQEWLPVR